MDVNQSLILLPIAGCLFVSYLIFRLGLSRDGRMPVDDLGFWWLVYLNIYTTLPTFVWFIREGVYGLFNQRLARLDPTLGDIFYLQSIAACYAISFAIFYWPIRRKAHTPSSIPAAPISSAKMLSAGLILGATFVIGLFVTGDPSAGYGDKFRAIASLPLEVRQILKLIGGLATVSMLVLLIAILQRWPRSRFFLFLYIIATLISFNPFGSRGQIVIMLFSLAIGWHTLVRTISVRKWLVGGLSGLLLFIAAGIFRSFASSPGDVFLIDIQSIGLGEFDQLWGNAIELLHASREGLTVPFNVQYGEFLAPIPSQFLPIEKSSLANWFLDTFYPIYKAEGGGWAFGALSQAVIGGGLIEAAVRGALLGCIIGLLFRWYRTPTSPWWMFPTYLYLIVTGYNSIRDTTFTHLTVILQTVLPSLLIIAIMGSLLSSMMGRPRKSDSVPLNLDISTQQERLK
ncbi:MAG: hypothetical protein HOL70_03860 [Candidatus Marinimicrobia bacterium]|jgi:hypothetical protein|nr:hypothetical protein [Candidatus Neomarinimicrobiota bacterium]